MHACLGDQLASLAACLPALLLMDGDPWMDDARGDHTWYGELTSPSPARAQLCCPLPLRHLLICCGHGVMMSAVRYHENNLLQTAKHVRDGTQSLLQTPAFSIAVAARPAVVEIAS